MFINKYQEIASDEMLQRKPKIKKRDIIGGVFLLISGSYNLIHGFRSGFSGYTSENWFDITVYILCGLGCIRSGFKPDEFSFDYKFIKDGKLLIPILIADITIVIAIVALVYLKFVVWK